MSEEPLICELCGSPAESGDMIEWTGLVICNTCIEETLDASTDQPRTEMGLVGSFGGRA